jgi:hypothetical protein
VSYTAALFEAIESQIVSEGPFPIALLILDEQFKHLPRTYDELKERDKVRFGRFKNADEAWAHVQELAEEQGLVISARRFSDFERWLATEFDGRTLHCEPPDGLARFRTTGRLPPLPEVVNDLSQLVPPGSEVRTALPSRPSELRRLMMALRSEEDAGALRLDARKRQGYGLALGIAVTSTPRERLEAEIATLAPKLPVPLQTTSEEKLKEARTQAARRGLESTALRVGDAVHLINVDEKITEAAGKYPWLQVETIAVHPNPLQRMIKAVSSWSEDDFLYDPFLERLIEQLDPRQQERIGFLHARAGLLLNQALLIKAASPVAGWQPALEALLSVDPPAASLRVRWRKDPIEFAGQQRPGFVVPSSFARNTDKDWPLRQVPPLTDLILNREDNLVEVLRYPVQHGYGSDYDSRSPSILLPATREAAVDPGFWLDLYEAWQQWREEEARPRKEKVSFVQRGKPARYEQLWSEHQAHLLRGDLKTWDSTKCEFAPSFWEEADRELATVWLALRLSVPSAPRIRLPDGGVLLQLSPGVLAEIRVTQRTAPQPGESLRASLLYVPVQEDRTSPLLPSFTVMAPTHAVNKGYVFGPSLPRGLHLRGERFNAEIRFRGSALLSHSPANPLAAAAAVTQTQDEEEARKRQEDDDDDD